MSYELPRYKVYTGKNAEAFHEGYFSGTGLLGGYRDFKVLVVVFGAHEQSVREWIKENCPQRAVVRMNRYSEAHVCFKEEADATAFVLNLIS